MDHDSPGRELRSTVGLILDLVLDAPLNERVAVRRLRGRLAEPTSSLSQLKQVSMAYRALARHSCHFTFSSRYSACLCYQ